VSTKRRKLTDEEDDEFLRFQKDYDDVPHPIDNDPEQFWTKTRAYAKFLIQCCDAKILPTLWGRRKLDG